MSNNILLIMFLLRDEIKLQVSFILKEGSEKNRLKVQL